MITWFGFTVGRCRLVSVLCASSLTLTACAGQVQPSQSLTPAQQQLKDANQRFNQTVGEGAVIGALAGGVLGAVLGGRNKAQMAAIGAGLGHWWAARPDTRSPATISSKHRPKTI